MLLVFGNDVPRLTWLITRSDSIKGRGEKGVKESTSPAFGSQQSCSPHHYISDARARTDKILSNGSDLTLTSESSHVPTQRKELPLRPITKEQDQLKSLPRHRETGSVPRTWDLAIDYNTFPTLMQMRESNYFEPAQTRYAQSAPSYTRGDLAPQACNLQQRVLYTMARHEDATAPPLPVNMHHLTRETRCRQEAHGSFSKVEELHERPWDARNPAFPMESRKRKRISSNEQQQMKPPINTQTPRNSKSQTLSPASESGLSQRFCPICDSTHCHHIIKEQTLSPVMLTISSKIGDQKSSDTNPPVELQISTRAQRRHTADISHQSMQAMTCTTSGPRRSIQYEHSIAGSLTQSTAGISRPPSMSLLADSGYSTAAGTSPGTQTSRSRTHDPASDDEEVQQTTKLRGEKIQQTRSSSMTIPGTQAPIPWTHFPGA